MTQTQIETTLKTTTCFNCEDPMPLRRPSSSGRHFCSKDDCRRARSRHAYHFNQADRAKAAERDEQERLRIQNSQLMAFVTATAGEDRPGCETCGRERIIPGYPHPRPDWSGRCPAGGHEPLPDGLKSELMMAAFPQAVMGGTQ